MRYLLTILIALPLLARNTETPAEGPLRDRIATLASSETAEINGTTEMPIIGTDEAHNTIRKERKRKYTQLRWSHWGLDADLIAEKGIVIPRGWSIKIDEYQGPDGVGAIVTYAKIKQGQVYFKRVHAGQGKYSFVDAWVPQFITTEDGADPVPMTEFPAAPVVPVEPAPVVEPVPEPNTKITPTP